MCRASNGFWIRHQHMAWKQDALIIFFRHMKNDQEGSRPKDGRHVFANPMIPEVCPILALAIYWASHKFTEDSHLFPGDEQYNRFVRSFKRILQQEEISAELVRRGVDVTELGSHSIRKGSATFCASGSTSCPPQMAINLRGGWDIGQVQSSYFRFQNAGDYFVGRTLCLLPSNHPDFALLPPHFREQSDHVTKAVKATFPGLPGELTYVAEHCLASLVYHAGYIRETFPANHPVLSNQLFTTERMIEKLKPNVLVGCGDDAKDTLKPSGMPPHVEMLRSMKVLHQQVETSIIKLSEQLEVSAKTIVKDITSLLEERAVGFGTVTYNGLNERLQEAFRAAGIEELVNAFKQQKFNVTSEASRRPSYKVVGSDSILHCWGGRFRRVPTDFVFPKCHVSRIWSLWWLGNKERNIPPYRFLQPSDMPNKNLRKRLSDVKFLMTSIEDLAREKGLLNQEPTVSTIDDILEECSDAWKVEVLTPEKRKRRHGQLQWQTVCKYVRRIRAKKT